MSAAEWGYTGTASLLIQHEDTDLDLRNRWGKTARILALRFDHYDIASLLNPKHKRSPEATRQ